MIHTLESLLSRTTPQQRAEGFDPCWIWQGTRSTFGYGVVTHGGRQWKAHRLVYTLAVAEVPAHLVIDHVCRVRECVNPSHLEPVTNAENVMRGESGPARYARRDHCSSGHPYTPENTLVGRRQRNCRTCLAEYRRRLKAKRDAARVPRVSTWGQNVTHGKGGTYRAYGCRCRPCTDANTRDSKRYRDQVKARKAGAA